MSSTFETSEEEIENRCLTCGCKLEKESIEMGYGICFNCISTLDDADNDLLFSKIFQAPSSNG